jgi:hypothetical protein
MNRVGIMINFHEYNALRAYTHREKRMIEAYYNRQNSNSYWILDPSLIVASLFHSHFEYEYKESDYGSSIMKFQIHEAMALSNALSTLGEPIFENLYSRLNDEIAKWKPSLTALTFENWYNNHRHDYKHQFGEFDELDEIYLDVFRQSFIEEHFKDDL